MKKSFLLILCLLGWYQQPIKSMTSESTQGSTASKGVDPSSLSIDTLLNDFLENSNLTSIEKDRLRTALSDSNHDQLTRNDIEQLISFFCVKFDVQISPEAIATLAKNPHFTIEQLHQNILSLTGSTLTDEELYEKFGISTGFSDEQEIFAYLSKELSRANAGSDLLNQALSYAGLLRSENYQTVTSILNQAKIAATKAASPLNEAAFAYACKKINPSLALSNQHLIALLAYIKGNRPQDLPYALDFDITIFSNAIQQINAATLSKVYFRAERLAKIRKINGIDNPCFAYAFGKENPELALDQNMISQIIIHMARSTHVRVSPGHAMLLASFKVGLNMTHLEELENQFKALSSNADEQTVLATLGDFLDELPKPVTVLPRNNAEILFVQTVRQARILRSLGANRHSLSRQALKSMAREIGSLKREHLEALIIASQCKANRRDGTIASEDIHDAATAHYQLDLAAHLLLDPAKLNAYVKTHGEDRIQFRVMSHKASGGAGDGATGYHVLRNGVYLARLCNALEENEQRDLLRALQNADEVRASIALENSPWRTQIIRKRKIKAFAGFINITLIRKIIGQPEVHHGVRPTGNHVFNLPLHQGWVQYGDIDARLIPLRALLIQALKSFTKQFLMQHQEEIFGGQYRLSGRTIATALQAFMQTPPNNIYRNLLQPNILAQLAPGGTVFVMNANSIQETDSGARLSQDLLNRVLNGYKGLGKNAGDWVTAKELQSLVDYELVINQHVRQLDRQAQFYVVPAVRNQQIEAQLLQLRNQFNQQESEFIAICFIESQKHWSVLVLNKIGSKKQVVLANSDSNEPIANHPIIIDFLTQVSEHPARTVAQTLDGRIEDDIQIFNPPVRDDSIPTVAELFHNNIPQTVTLAISYYKNQITAQMQGFSDKPHLLLYGPPGTGKSTLPQRLAIELQRPLFYKSGSDFITKWQGSGAENLRTYFAKAARQEGGAILFIDEFDSIAKQLDNSETVESRNTLNELKNLIIEYSNRPETNLLIICATNETKSDEANSGINDAIWDRFQSVRMGDPDINARWEIIGQMAQKYNLQLSYYFKNNLHIALHGLGMRQIKRIFEKSALSKYFRLPANEQIRTRFYSNVNTCNPNNVGILHAGLNSVFAVGAPISMLLDWPFNTGSPDERHVYWAYDAEFVQTDKWGWPIRDTNFMLGVPGICNINFKQNIV